MRRSFALVIITLVFFLSLLVVSNSLLVSFSNKEFNSTTETLYINWTNNYRGNITVGSNRSYAIYIQVLNASNNVIPYYGQPQAGIYNSECGYGAEPNGRLFFDVANATGYSNNTLLLNNNSVVEISISPYYPCPSGRYYGYLNITNATNTSEFINVTVIVDYPISAVKTRDMSNGVGQFKGVIQTNSSYHSYYFNTSEVENATSASISLSWNSLNDDVDLFLFDQNGNLLAKSINRSTGESLIYNYLPSNQMWEIRIYGNSSSILDYTSSGSLIFSTLSIKNSSSQQINLIDFGLMNVNDTRMENMTLENVGNLSASSVQESVEIYHFETSNSNNAPRNFSFVIPAFATNVRASINWTGDSVYNISLYKPDGTLVGTSGSKRSIANMTKSMQEEFIEAGSVGSNNEGVWRLEVKNTTPSATYTVQLKYWLPSSQWVSSNYTTSTLSYFGNKTDYHFNFTVPNNTLSGNVYGNFKYRSSSGQAIQFSIKANVSTGVLMLNNTLNQGSVTIRENIGENVTRTISLPITNNGTSPINLGPLVNSTNLTYGNNHMNFSTSYPSSLAPGQSGVLNITIYVNTLGTGNNPGVYSGWVFLNATNARPYAGYTLTINVDLTRELAVNVVDFKTSDGNEWMENVSRAENATFYFKVYYVNGTEITNLDATNFTTSWFVEGNSNYFTSNTTLSVFNPNAPNNQTRYGDRYLMNTTIASGYPGGNYTGYIEAKMIKNGLTFIGVGGNSSALRINNAGFLLNNKTTKALGEFNELTSVYFNASLENIGSLPGSGNLIFNNGSCKVVATADGNPTCSGSGYIISPYGTTGWVVTFPANRTASCNFRWKLTGINVSSNSQCTDASVTISNYALNSLSGISMTVKNTDSGSSSGTTTTTTTILEEEEPVTEESEESTTTQQFFDIDYETQIEIEQGKNYTTNVNVVNVNKTHTQTVRVSILLINSSWVKVSPATYTSLGSGDSYIFRAIYTIPEDAAVNDYLGQIQVESKDHTERKDFTLSVLPGDKLKVEINETLLKYENETLTLELKMNQTKIKGDNATLIQNKIQVLHQMIEEARAHIATGNYRSAYNLLDDIQRLINETATQQNNLLTRRTRLSNLNWLLFIGAAIIIPASVAGYIYWPKYSPKLKALRFRFKKPVRQEKLEELKKIKENLKEEEIKRELLKKEFSKLGEIEQTLKKEVEEIIKIKKDLESREKES